MASQNVHTILQVLTKLHDVNQWKRSEAVFNVNDDDRVPETGCAYRGAGGLRCGIGWLIPDDQYSPSLEGYSASSVAERVPSLQSYAVSLLNELQEFHDSHMGNTDMHNAALKRLGEKYADDALAFAAFFLADA